jgi:hypothetical protein
VKEKNKMKCLLIETRDKKRFFTHKKNLIQLNEFSKTFNSDLFLVEAKDAAILELEDLAKELCNLEYKNKECEFKIINQIKIKEKENKVKNNIGIKIQDFIKKEFLEKRPISIKKIKSKFKKYSISDATLYNKMKKVKSELEKKGFKFLKIKSGVYKTK